MVKAYCYLRTSGDDGRNKAGLPVQRDAVLTFAGRNDYQIAAEFADDGVTGKLPMHARPQGKLLISALLADGVRTVLCYDSKRIGRTQPAFWSFIGLCRDNAITVLDASGTDLCGSVMGGVNGMLAEMDREATVARLAAGKAFWRAASPEYRAAHGKAETCSAGRYHYGEHPSVMYAGERDVVARIKEMHGQGRSSYAIAQMLNAEGVTTRYGHKFRVTTVQRIIARG